MLKILSKIEKITEMPSKISDFKFTTKFFGLFKKQYCLNIKKNCIQKSRRKQKRSNASKKDMKLQFNATPPSGASLYEFGLLRARSLNSLKEKTFLLLLLGFLLSFEE